MKLLLIAPHVFFLLKGGTSASASMLTLLSSVDPVVFSPTGFISN